MIADDWESFRDLRLRALADSPQSFRSTFDEERARSDEEWQTMQRDVAEHPDAVTWVAEAEGVPVGQAFSRIRDDGVLRIGGMWVAPEGRGNGFGWALLAAAEDWGRSRGSTVVSLQVTDGNSAAQRLHTAAGYQPTGACEPLRAGSPLECVELEKRLTPAE
jgi:RimJ/RimL family protein N-acetyltransferase